MSTLTPDLGPDPPGGSPNKSGGYTWPPESETRGQALSLCNSNASWPLRAIVLGLGALGPLQEPARRCCC